jgi:hypothetical protein
MTNDFVEAIPKKRREIIAGKYMVQYTFSAIASAATVPLMDAVGTGPAGTIGESFLSLFLHRPLILSRCNFGSPCWTSNLHYCQTGSVDAGMDRGETWRKIIDGSS